MTRNRFAVAFCAAGINPGAVAPLKRVKQPRCWHIWARQCTGRYARATSFDVFETYSIIFTSLEQTKTKLWPPAPSTGSRGSDQQSPMRVYRIVAERHQADKPSGGENRPRAAAVNNGVLTSAGHGKPLGSQHRTLTGWQDGRSDGQCRGSR